MANAIVYDIYARTHGEKDVGRLSKQMGALAIAGGVLAAKFAVDSVKAFAEAEQSQNRLTDAFAKFPKLADISQKSLTDYNAQLALKTRFDDDATASGQAVLAQFGLTGTQVKTLTPLLQDYAAKTGKDLPTAAKDLGKAVLGQGKALKAVGLNFKDTGSATGNLAELTKGLRSQVGGFAEKEGKTATGQAEILKNQFGELQEQVGEGLVPILKQVAGVLLGIIGFIQRNTGTIVPLIKVVGSLTAVIYGLIVAQRISAFLTRQQTEQTILYTVASKVCAVATKAWAVATYILGGAIKFAMGPVGLIILGVAAAAAGIIFLATKTQFFQTIWRVAWGGIKKAFDATWNFIRTKWPLILAILTGPIGIAVLVIVRHWKAIKDGAVKAFNAVVDWLRHTKDSIIGIFASAATWLANAGRRVINGLWGGLKAAWASVTHWLGGIGRAIISYYANAGTWLYGKGKAVLQGLWDGLSFVWHKITGWISGLTGWIKDHKGPPSLDKNLLVQAGKDIMGGFFNGLKHGGLKALGFVEGIAGNIGQILGGGPSSNSGNESIVKGMAQQFFGWQGAQWTALRALIMGESGFNNTAQNPTSSAYGMFQFLNDTWGSVGISKTSNPNVQALGGLRYIKQRYGSPINAFSAWLNRSPHWYGSGMSPTVFSQPTLIGVGESGPETVTVTPHGRGGAGGGITVIINGVVGDRRVVAQWVRTAIRDSLRAEGKTAAAANF